MRLFLWFSNTIPFSDPSVVKIANLKNGLNVAELFHGPTMAFKDLALGVVGELYNYFLERSKKHCIVLVGTSGDTGSAAISAVRGLSAIDIIVLLPGGRCTKIQQLQMTTVHDKNIHNFVGKFPSKICLFNFQAGPPELSARPLPNWDINKIWFFFQNCDFSVDGTSDDLDIPIKKVFADPDFVAKHNLCSINSINWARILVQIAHYIYIYFQAKKTSDRVKIIVPTGAAGNIASGFVASKMGFPMELIAVVNPNDIVHRTIKSGDMSMAKEVHPSWASAMDIQVLTKWNHQKLTNS